MNFRQLEYIIAVEKHRNFNRAAIECDVAQSTLSKEIQRLEKEFGILIFDRSRNPVVPTLKGIDLIQKAKEIRFQKREFTQIAKKKKNEVSGQISLAITEILAPYITPVFVNKIQNKYPKLEIKILELSDRRIEDFLIAEEIDAAVMIDPFLTHGYYEQKLFEEELCVYSTKKLTKNLDHRIPVSVIDFNHLILHEDLRRLLLRKNNHNISLEKIEKSNINYLKGNLETLKNIINLNNGTMFLPKIATNYLGKNHLDKVYTLKNKPLKLDVSLVSTRAFEKERILKRLFNELSNLFAE